MIFGHPRQQLPVRLVGPAFSYQLGQRDPLDRVAGGCEPRGRVDPLPKGSSWRPTRGLLEHDGGVTARFKDLCLDANDHQRMVDWWCRALGYERRAEYRPPTEPIPIEDPRGEGPLIWVNPVPEGKSVKNRMHIDVYGDTDDLVALGATLLRKRDDDELFWDVLADPEGNEFCVFAPAG
jgi:hypothetical protein